MIAEKKKYEWKKHWGKSLHKCSYCGKEHLARNFDIKNKGNTYCSRACYYKARDMRIASKCAICGKDYLASSHLIKKGQGKCCSDACARKSKIRKVVLSCEICGKDYVVHGYRKNISRTCSRLCQNKFLSEKFSGERSHAWRGGVTPELMKIRALIIKSAWHKEVFARDNYTCQKCGIRSGMGKAVRLEAHHIKPFKQIIEEIKTSMPILTLLDGAKMYAPLWDVSNGITYCTDCHKHLHGLSRKGVK